MADVLARRQAQHRFTWGGANIVEPNEIRRRYINALRGADKNDIAPLLTFSRS